MPVSTTDQLAKSTVYLTPFHGNNVALYDGANWKLHELTSDLALALGTKTARLPYDVFMYDNAGNATLEDLAWTDATTRATALTTQDGGPVKARPGPARGGLSRLARAGMSPTALAPPTRDTISGRRRGTKERTVRRPVSHSTPPRPTLAPDRRRGWRQLITRDIAEARHARAARAVGAWP